MNLTADQVLAWRLRRQFLEPRTSAPATEIVARLCGVQTQVASAAETTIASRRLTPDPSGIAQGLDAGSLIKTWAMRGTLHLCRSDRVAGYLSLMAAARTWVKPSWQKAFGATPDQVEQLGAAVREILDGAVLTREELVAELVSRRQFADLEDQLRSGWGTLLKPLAWQGALCYGPGRGSRITFTTPGRLIPGWTGLPDPEEAAPAVISAYLGAYGPAGPESFDAWLTRGNTKKGVLRGWFASLGNRFTEVRVEGREAFVLTEHADELAAMKSSRAVRLLGPFDAYVLGATTRDTWMLPADHRARVSRAAGWIAPVILSGGRIVGTWERTGEDVVPQFFPGEKVPSTKALAVEVTRVTEN